MSIDTTERKSTKGALVRVVVFRTSLGSSIASVDFSVTSQVGDNREVASTALDFASEC